MFGTELAEIYELVGMPCQDWWRFHFTVPFAERTETDVDFGKVFANWKLTYRAPENIVLYSNEKGEKHFANSNFVAFNLTLVLFDQGCKRIQRECPGDSGKEWNIGDVIIQEMEASMRKVDPGAFQKNSNLWPYLLIDING